MQYSVHEAKTQFSKLLDQVERGEEVEIVRRGRPVARLVRPKSASKPRLGAMRGEIEWKEGWEKSLTDDEADSFVEGRW